MATEYVHFAKRKGLPDYMEEVVLVTTNPLTPEQKSDLTAALERNGMEYRRVFEYNGEAPDFAGTVNI